MIRILTAIEVISCYVYLYRSIYISILLKLLPKGPHFRQEHLRASTCSCMAPSFNGLKRSLELQDPFVLLHLSGVSFQLSATESEGRFLARYVFLIFSLQMEVNGR